MSADLPILDVARAMARHAVARHTVIAGNVANADTPGYRARDLTPFDAYAALRQGGKAEPPRAKVLRGLPVEPGGNSVSVEDQMVRAAEATLQHKTALGIYRKSLDLLRMSLGKR